MGFFSSSSSSSQSSEAYDMRQVGGANSPLSNLRIDLNKNKNSTINLTDGGAVSQAITLAVKGIEGAQQTAREAVASNSSLLDGVFSSASKQQEQFTSAVENIKTSDVRTLIIAGLAVVALVAVQLFRKG